MTLAQFNYSDNGDGTCTLTAYTGSGGVVTIPSLINGLTNTGIGNFAFFNKSSLSGITIPDTVTSIGVQAFADCHNLTSVMLGNGIVNLGAEAFYQCGSFTSITLPASVGTIGNQAFSQCAGLTGIYFQGNSPSIGSSVFSGDSSATVYYFTGTTGWSSTFGGLPTLQVQFTYSINGGAITLTGYLGSSGNVTIPDTIIGLPVTSLGSGVFYNNTNLTKVTISTNVSNIATDAFYGCTNLMGVYFQGDAPSVGASVFSGDNSATAFYFTGTTGWGATFAGLPLVQYQFTYIINNTTITTLKYVGSSTHADVPNSMYGLPVTSIGSYTFNANGLVSVTIGTNISNIGDHAFFYCTNLASVVIPTNVTTIGVTAFGYCYDLTNVTIPSSIGIIPSSAFVFCYRLNNVTIPNSVTNIGNSAFFECGSLAKVTIGTSVRSLVEEAFSECTSLTNITIPSSVTYIDDSAFSYCSNLKGVFFQGNAPTIGGSFVFQYDTNATVYYLPGATGWGTTFAGLPTALWTLPYPVILTSNPGFGVQTNQFGFTISWATNLSVVVEACTNLTNPVWHAVQTNALSAGSSYFTDPQLANNPGKFYRLRSP